MATNVTERTKTVFEAVGVSRYSRAMGAVGNSASLAGRGIGGVTSMLKPLNIALSGVALYGGARAMAMLGGLGSEFESVRARLAGTLSALGFTPDFNKGLIQAKKTMETIYADAAALPGEAEDYVEIFTTALPFVKASMGGTVQEMTKFTNLYGAVAASMRVHSAEAAVHLTRMIQAGQGMASQRFAMFRNLLPYMKLVEGQADLTTRSFNEMTGAERFKLVEHALGKMGPMIDEMKKSYDAVSGALKTALRQTTRMATAPLFEAMKRSMGRVADLLYGSNGQLTEFGFKVVALGNKISMFMGRALESVVDKLVYISIHWDEIGEKIKRAASYAPAVAGAIVATKMAPAIIGAGATVAGAAVVGGAAGGGGAGAALTALLPTMSSFLKLLGQLGVIVAVVTSAIDVVTTHWTTLGSTFGVVGGLLMSTFGDLIAILLMTAQVVGGVLKPLVAGILVVITPALTVLAAILKVVAHSLKLVVAVIKLVVNVMYEALQPNFDMLFGYFAEFAGWLKKLVGVFVEVTDSIIQQANALKPSMGVSDQQQAQLAALGLADWTPLTEMEKLAKRGPPKGKGGTKVTQDFRHSRFTVEQKFAEGFDPDRIAVAFAKDVGRLGEQKLQSGFEPLFSVR